MSRQQHLKHEARGSLPPVGREWHRIAVVAPLMVPLVLLVLPVMLIVLARSFREAGRW